MQEANLHQHIYDTTQHLRHNPHITVGPGDDCAVITTSAGDPILLSVDHLVEGRHIERNATPDRIARKAVARAVSDIAAMAGTPTHALATGCIPPRWGPHAEELCDRLAHWAHAFDAPIVGGDVATPAEEDEDTPLILTITTLGTPHPKRGPALRADAKPDDTLWTTGPLGASFRTGWHADFTPRTREGWTIAERCPHHLGAMIDVSDGLGRDAARIAHASNVTLVIEAQRIPRRADATIDEAVQDGEDYELLFTLRPGAEDAINDIPDLTPTMIGRVEPNRPDTPPGAHLIDGDGTRTDISTRGWDHRTGDER